MRGLATLSTLLLSALGSRAWQAPAALRCGSAGSRSSSLLLAATADRDSAVNKLSMASQSSPWASIKSFIAQKQAGEYDEVAVKKRVDSLIADNKVVMFSFVRCPFCIKAKSLLSDLIGPSGYVVVEVDTDPQGKAIRYELSKITGRTSVPQIFIKREFVGGCNDGPGVVPLNESGELIPKLKAAGCKLLTAK
jgi:glutaredoxin 3